MGNIFSTPERNIVLIGSTGNGKSSAGNMILKKQGFITKASADPVTTECQRSENMVFKKNITVIDTPDFFDIEDDDEEKMKPEIIRALVECAGGIHAFVIVLKVGRYTTTEKKMVKQLLNTLREDVWKHTVILFTFGKQLEGQDIKEFVKTNSQLQDLVEKCEGRCHVIDKCWGKSKKKEVIKKLLETIDVMEEMHRSYSNDLLKKVEEQIQQEMKKNSPEEAKNNVHGTIWRRLAGAATGAVFGAFLGVRGEGVSALQRKISESLENVAVPFVENTFGAAAAYGVSCVTGGFLKGAVDGLVSGWNAEDADSACDGRSKAASTSHEHAITLMKKALTELENAKDMLETATNILQKK